MSWCWPYENVCIVADRPAYIGWDERERVHNAVGPAIALRDGYRVYAIHGVRVPEQVVMAPETLTPEQIRDETNAEVRRVMIERYGVERYLRGVSAEIVSMSEDAILYRAGLVDDEPLVMVRVLNSTREADNSQREYYLRVPPDMTDARQAVAWTFGLTADEYRPQVET